MVSAAAVVVVVVAAAVAVVVVAVLPVVVAGEVVAVVTVVVAGEVVSAVVVLVAGEVVPAVVVAGDHPWIIPHWGSGTSSRVRLGRRYGCREGLVHAPVVPERVGGPGRHHPQHRHHHPRRRCSYVQLLWGPRRGVARLVFGRTAGVWGRVEVRGVTHREADPQQHYPPPNGR